MVFGRGQCVDGFSGGKKTTKMGAGAAPGPPGTPIGVHPGLVAYAPAPGPLIRLYIYTKTRARYARARSIYSRPIVQRPSSTYIKIFMKVKVRALVAGCSQGLRATWALTFMNIFIYTTWCSCNGAGIDRTSEREVWSNILVSSFSNGGSSMHGESGAPGLPRTRGNPDRARLLHHGVQNQVSMAALGLDFGGFGMFFGGSYFL